ncbi:Efflux pump periplasmic linker BepF [Halioglobus japonicus]|nr:Efflux pump periplasmic linker BepF [Halioglobus japonicus]
MSVLTFSTPRMVATLLMLPGVLAAAIALSQPNQGVPVRVDVVTEQPIQRIIELTGTVMSPRSARLSTATAGLVTDLQVDVGSLVEKGDVLLELDQVLAQSQWHSSAAGTDVARLAAADSTRRLQEARALIPQKSIAESAVRDLEAEVAQDAADLQRAQAETAYAKGVLDRHQLRAPFSGVVSAKETELGEWVTPGQPVLTLVATRELYMDFPVSEDYLMDVALDTPVSYNLGDNSRDARAGVITTTVPVTDPGARTFLLRVQPTDTDPRMFPGMSARAQLTLTTGRSGLTVPRDAILNYPDGRVVVWVVNSDADGASVSETLVKTGVVFDGRVEIVEGLSADAQVVVQGNEALQNDQQVTVLPVLH